MTEEVSLSLKAETPQDREKWIQALVQHTSMSMSSFGFGSPEFMQSQLEKDIDEAGEDRIRESRVKKLSVLNNLKAFIPQQQPTDDVGEAPSISDVTELL